MHTFHADFMHVSRIPRNVYRVSHNNCPKQLWQFVTKQRNNDADSKDAPGSHQKILCSSWTMKLYTFPPFHVHSRDASFHVQIKMQEPHARRSQALTAILTYNGRLFMGHSKANCVYLSRALSRDGLLLQNFNKARDKMLMK